MDRIEKLRAFLERQPGDPFLLHALALEYVKMGDDGMARELFEKVLAFNPLYTGTFYHLGKLLERKGEKDAAIAIYEKGMEVCKQAGDAHALRELQTAYEDLVY